MTSHPVVVWLAEGTWQSTVKAAAAIAPPEHPPGHQRK